MNAEKTERVLREMRERALLLDSHPEYTARDLQQKKLKEVKEQQQKRVEDFKRLYFNAGRWAGGARDHVAREAFEKMNRIDR